MNLDESAVGRLLRMEEVIPANTPVPFSETELPVIAFSETQGRTVSASRL